MLKKIENEDKTKKYDTFYLHSKAKSVINDSDIDVVFESIYTTILWNTQKSLGKGSSWIMASFIEHNTIISMSSLLVGSSYIKSPKELDYSRTVLTYIQNIDDNEYFKWSLVRYLNPLDHHPARMTKCDKGFGKRLDCKCIKLPVKIRDIQKIEKKNPNTIDINAFGYENKNKYPIYVYKNVVKKTCWFTIDRRRRQKTLWSY